MSAEIVPFLIDFKKPVENRRHPTCQFKLGMEESILHWNPTDLTYTIANDAKSIRPTNPFTKPYTVLLSSLKHAEYSRKKKKQTLNNNTINPQ